MGAGRHGIMGDRGALAVNTSINAKATAEALHYLCVPFNRLI